MDKPNQQNDYENIIFSIWLNWTLSTGSFTLLVMLSLWIPCIWMPLAALALTGVMMIYNREAAVKRRSLCFLLPGVAIRVLFFSAMIMLAISIAGARGILSTYFEEELLNEKIPFISVLIVAPIAFLTSAWYMIQGWKSSICRGCIIRYGSGAERGFIGRLLSQESRYQLMFLAVMAGIITIVTATYFFLYYVNVNINRSDAFIFVWIPVILYALSVIYMGARYVSVWGYYCQDVEGSDKRTGSTTWVRFIIVSGESIFLSHSDEFSDRVDLDKIDTPANLILPYREKGTLKEAEEAFTDISSLPADKYSLRFMYLSKEARGLSNIFHFIVSLDNREIINSSALRGKWYSISQLQRLLYNRDLAPILAAEINRLHTVAMAWKTYDKDGNRLYRIKNYRPMFRLSGIADWDVDFNDPHWLYVSRFNEDKPFFKIRRLWRRIFRKPIE